MIATVAQVTQVMRDADKRFETSGGSTRHYVRDVLFPMLEEAGLFIVSLPDKPYKQTIDELEVKRSIARGLREKGYSLRQIQKALGYKSVRSVHLIVK